MCRAVTAKLSLGDFSLTAYERGLCVEPPNTASDLLNKVLTVMEPGQKTSSNEKPSGKNLEVNGNGDFSSTIPPFCCCFQIRKINELFYTHTNPSSTKEGCPVSILC